MASIHLTRDEFKQLSAQTRLEILQLFSACQEDKTTGKPGHIGADQGSEDNVQDGYDRVRRTLAHLSKSDITIIMSKIGKKATTLLNSIVNNVYEDERNDSAWGGYWFCVEQVAKELEYANWGETKQVLGGISKAIRSTTDDTRPLIYYEIEEGERYGLISDRTFRNLKDFFIKHEKL